MDIKYVNGDATTPIGDGEKVIAHICNDIGVWGAGFVMALSKKWSRPELSYKYAHKEGQIALGKIQVVDVENGIDVCNMIAQEGVGPNKLGREPVRYDALILCLRKLANYCLVPGWPTTSVHMPRIGCGLGGGRWEIVEPIIRVELCERNVPVTIYDWKG
jgi:O-acetyl-ADP-ribose deacetylase (regulator of RNase III)